MYELQVEKMTCGGCASRVTKAILGADSAAKVNVDLKSKLVRIESDVDAEALAAAVSEAGYPATVTSTTP